MLRLILALALMATAAPAEEPLAAKRRFLGLGESEKWTGVGRLNAEGGFCTAALIAPKTVLTAAHCIYDRSGAQLPLRALRFVAGSRTGQHTATRKVIAAEAHPDWRGFGGGVRVPGDLAVLTLESPITLAEGRSYGTGAAPDLGDDVFLLSYGRDRETALSIQAPCQVIARHPRSATLNCDVTYGASGSPVFRDGRIVAVISAMSVDGSGRRVAHAALLDGMFQEMVAPAAPPRPAARARFSAAPQSGSRLPGGKRPPQ